jgi:hypothetical protein
MRDPVEFLASYWWVVLFIVVVVIVVARGRDRRWG